MNKKFESSAYLSLGFLSFNGIIFYNFVLCLFFEIFFFVYCQKGNEAFVYLFIFLIYLAFPTIAIYIAHTAFNFMFYVTSLYYIGCLIGTLYWTYFFLGVEGLDNFKVCIVVLYSFPVIFTNIFFSYVCALYGYRYATLVKEGHIISPISIVMRIPTISIPTSDVYLTLC